MNIIDIKQFHVPVVGKELLIVQVIGEDGQYGIGEATLREKVAAVSECIKSLKAKIIGEDIFSIEKLFFQNFYHDRWRNGVIMNTALSGIEMAIYDLQGKVLGQPVYNLLGGKVRDKILLYVNGWQDLDGLPAATNALRMKKEGYKAMKWNPIPEVDIFASDYELKIKEAVNQAIEEVKNVREAVGDAIELFIECHGRLDYDNALRLVRGIEAYKPSFIEETMQPDNILGLQRLSTKTDIPLAGGERLFTRWGHLKLYQQGYLSIAQPDFTHCGGLMEAKKVSALAETFYVKIAPHNSSGPIATIASGQVDMTLANFYMQEFVYKKNKVANEDYFKNSMIIEDGYLLIGSQAGLGIDVNIAALSQRNMLV